MNLRKKLNAFDEGMSVYCALLKDEEDILIPFAISLYVTICKITELLHRYLDDLDRHECRETLGNDIGKMMNLAYLMKGGKLKRDMEALAKISLKDHGYEIIIKGFKPETTMDLYQAIERKVMEMIDLLKEVDRKLSEAPISLYGQFYEYQKSLCDRATVEAVYAGYKRDVGVLTYDLLKDKQIFEVAELLKRKVLRFTQEPSQREIACVDIDTIRLHLPPGYVLPEGFEKCCARFKRFCSCDGNILRIDRNQYGYYLFRNFYDLTPEDRQDLVSLDIVLDLIHQDMMRLSKEKKEADKPVVEVDDRVKAAIETMKEEKVIQHLYDYTWVMAVMNETQGLPSFDSAQSFLTYLESLGIDPLPDVSNVKKEYNRMDGKFPDWTFQNKDKTESDRRINVAKRFLNLYRKA